MPIIVSLVALKKAGEGENTEYTITTNSVFFYKFQSNEDKFCYEENLNKIEKAQATIAFSCYSLADEECLKGEWGGYADGNELPSKKFLMDCDIRSLIMLSAAGHYQLKVGANLSDGTKENGEEKYAEELYRKHSDELGEQERYSIESNFYLEPQNVFGDYNQHRKLAGEYGMCNASYSNDLKDKDDIKITRRGENTLFAARHVCVSNYSREHERMQGVNVGTKLDKVQTFKLSEKEKKVKSAALEELGFSK